MKKGSKAMKAIIFKEAPKSRILNSFAVDAAATAIANLGPTLSAIYDCWRHRLHAKQNVDSETLINFLFLVDGQSSCANANTTKPPPWRRGHP